MNEERKFIREFIRHSNAIEGYVHTAKDIDVVLAHVDKAEASGKPILLTNPYVIQQYRAIQYVKENSASVPKLYQLCELHKILMDGLMRGAGTIRWGAVMIGSRVAPKHTDLHFMLQDWIDTWPKTLQFFNNKEQALIRHYEFEHIHPFFDGNGRVGRLLLLWDCLHHKCDMDIIKEDTRLLYYDQIEDYCKKRSTYIGEWS